MTIFSYHNKCVIQAFKSASLTAKTSLDLYLPLRCPGRREARGLENFMGEQVDPGNEREGKEEKSNLERNPHLPSRNPARAILRIAVRHEYGVLALV